MNNKIKNLHYLNKYVNLESLLKETVNDAREGKTLDGFQKLKEFVKTLTVELVRYNSLFNDVSFPDFDTVLAELRKKNILTEEQKDLFYSINDYNPLKEGNKTDRNNLESLRNFYVRVDNELPSIMAHLGVGGSKKSKIKEETNINSKEPEVHVEKQEVKNEDSTVKTKEKVKVNTKPKKPLTQKLKGAYESKPAFVIRFIVVGGIAGVLIYYTFINKLTSEILDDFLFYQLEEANYIWQYIAVTMTKNLFGFIGGLFKTIFDGIVGIFNFLKFE